MLHRTLIAFAATVALGCIPIATNAFAAGHRGVHSGRHAMAGHPRGGHFGGHRFARGGYHHFGGYRYAGYPGYGGCGYYGCGYGPPDVIGNVVGGVGNVVGGVLDFLRF